jgi:hypothetical protein
MPPRTPSGRNTGNYRPGAGQSSSATRNVGRILGWTIMRGDPGSWHRHVMLVFFLHLILQLARSKFSVDDDQLSGQGQMVYREMMGRTGSSRQGTCPDTGPRANCSTTDVPTKPSGHELGTDWR